MSKCEKTFRNFKWGRWTMYFYKGSSKGDLKQVAIEGKEL